MFDKLSRILFKPNTTDSQRNHVRLKCTYCKKENWYIKQLKNFVKCKDCKKDTLYDTKMITNIRCDYCRREYINVQLDKYKSCDFCHSKNKQIQMYCSECLESNWYTFKSPSSACYKCGTILKILA